MKMIKSFDPGASMSGEFDHQVANPCGGVYLFNESDIWVQLTLPGGGDVGLPAWWSRFYKLEDVKGPVLWKELATINSVARPLSRVYGESYERNEIAGRSFYDGPIPRNPFVANQVDTNVSGSNSVANDNNPPGTIFVEGKQSGNSAGSNIAIGNDGSFIFAQFVSSALTQYFKGVPGANPLVQLGAKAFLQMADNAGVLGTILNIDASGNTIFQQHPTGGEFIFNDSAGNRLVVIDGTGHLVVNNDQSIRGRDNGGTAQALFKYDTSNNVLFVTGTSGNLNVQDNNTDTTFAGFNINNGLNLLGVSKSVNGDTSGSMTLTEFLCGTVKIAMIKHSNYRQNAASAQQLLLSNPFAGPFLVAAMGNATMQLLSGASVQSGNYLNSMSATGSTFLAESTIGQCVVGWNNTAIDRVQCPGSIASAHTGVIALIGF